MAPAPIVLVPGFWLGAWAWDEVADALRADGHDVTALTLPGLESPDTDRSRITMEDHVEAIVRRGRGRGCSRRARRAQRNRRAWLRRERSGAGEDRRDGVRRLRSGEGRDSTRSSPTPRSRMPSIEELAEEENLDGLTDEHLETFRRRAVPQPGASLREAAELTNDARLDVPSTVICTGFPSEQVKACGRRRGTPGLPA